ncbi:MAG: rhomboid family intramembrane serine protease [Bdellovibrionales bacterium RIFCSPHIGHO2_01_FULL_40_29]|nr:MAG: rhomboid family intramembrane serine protease [Bdellovibrionales bacterium RIFCSPHIGHO2_01_FULL_40_29]OFZ33389.1 MAG: rhomboid family intramembrane serine protease [Bdellovibrionales bacterium RIFCSPHIGHO2_02_FULL_40_15]
MNQVQMAPLTPVVKKLVVAMVAIWLVVQIFADKIFGMNISTWFILHPDQVIENFWLWQMATYIFFHALSPFHIFFNLMMLWFIGADLERHWGARFFTTYFFVTGVGAAILYCFAVAIYAAITGAQGPLVIPVMGASGALFGLMVAYGIIFAERVVYIFGVLPLKAKYFAMIAAAIELSSMLTTGFAGGEVAHMAHLGGALVGYLFLLFHARWKKQQTRSKLKKKTSKLRLVVDNDKMSSKEDGPKYWN